MKSSLAPGSKVVTQYLDAAGLSPHLDELGFQTVGYGCTTCIGNSGPLPDEISRAVAEGDLAVVAVLSGNRNFEARIHPEVKANYLASPPLVVAYALAGRMDLDLVDEPLGTGADGEDVYLADIWPSPQEVQEVIGSALRREMFEQTYADVYTGDERWRALDIPSGLLYEWDPASTYIRRPPYFDGMGREPEPVGDIAGRPLPRHGRRLRDDRPHLARRRHQAGQPGRPLPRRARHRAQGLQLLRLPPRQPRGDDPRHVRQRPAAQPPRPRARRERGPCICPSGEETTIFEAAERYREEGVPLVVIAGKEYGSGSSRDWAAKGPALLGVRAVLAESYERIHRSNLLMMGVLPLQFIDGDGREALGLTGRELFSIEGIDGGEAREVTVRADDREFRARVRLDTPREREYYRHGGILRFVLRRLLDA